MQHALKSHFRWQFRTAHIHMSAHGRWTLALSLSLYHSQSLSGALQARSSALCGTLSTLRMVIHSHIRIIGHVKCNLDYYFRISTSTLNEYIYW